MNRFAALIAASVLLTGCAMPVPVQVASLLLDTASVVSTEKTLTDHGLSALAGQDCALWRGLQDGAVCRGAGDRMLNVAFAAGPQMQRRAQPVIDGPYLKIQ